MTALCHVCAARAAEAAMRGLKQRPAPQQPAAEPADASCDPQPHPFILLVRPDRSVSVLVLAQVDVVRE